MLALFSLTALSDGVPKKVAEVSVIWVLMFMFPLKIVHQTKQREETVCTSRTCFLLKYWPQRLLYKSLLRSLYKVKCLLSGEKQAYIKNKTQDFYCKFLQLYGICYYLLYYHNKKVNYMLVFIPMRTCFWLRKVDIQYTVVQREWHSLPLLCWFL